MPTSNASIGAGEPGGGDGMRIEAKGSHDPLSTRSKRLGRDWRPADIDIDIKGESGRGFSSYRLTVSTAEVDSLMMTARFSKVTNRHNCAPYEDIPEAPDDTERTVL
jgi:hypothetical protein